MSPKDPLDDERTLITKVKVASRRSEGNDPCLHLQAGPGAPRAFVIHSAAMAIGRDPSADIPIDSPILSRRHALVRRVGDQTLILDTESANGVFVNGVKVHSAALHDGDQIQLADVELVFRGH